MVFYYIYFFVLKISLLDELKISLGRANCLLLYWDMVLGSEVTRGLERNLNIKVVKLLVVTRGDFPGKSIYSYLVGC